MELCQFFTSNQCSEALVSAIDTAAPERIVDVGAGHGSLAMAAMRRWHRAQLTLFDIDPFALKALKQTCPDADRFRANFLRDRLPRNARKWIEHADVVLCNPPFRAVAVELANRLLAGSDMPSDWPAKLRCRAEMIFLAHNLRFLRPGGELAMILPAAFINGHDFEPFRAWLLDTYIVTKVIQLPPSAFSRADVRAFAVIIRKSSPSTGHVVQLLNFSRPDGPLGAQRIARHQGIVRLDPEFHRLAAAPAHTTTLADIGVRISRGKPVSDLRDAGVRFIHTTDFSRHSMGGNLKASSRGCLPELPLAQVGDILMGRIGRSCFNQVLRVQQGKIHYSDCVYKIEVPQPHQEMVLSSLANERGVRWRQTRLHGSTVNLLSKRDLLQHPIWLER